MSQPIRGQAGHLAYPMGPKNTDLVGDIKYFFPVNFSQVLFSSCRGEVENGSTNQRPGQSSLFSDCKERLNVAKEKLKTPLPIRGQDSHLVHSPNNTQMVTLLYPLQPRDKSYYDAFSFNPCTVF